MGISMPRHLNHCGSAVITALFIMALVAIATTAMTYRLQIDVKRLQWINTSLQIQNSLTLPFYWARGNLLVNIESADEDEENAPLKLPQKMPPVTKHGIILSGELNDAQGAFNLNNLIVPNPTPEARKSQAGKLQVFANLIHLVLPELDNDAAFEKAVKIAEMIMAQGTSTLLMSKRELPVNQFVSVSELRAFSGLTTDQYERLTPFLTALPEATNLNINSASKTVLKAYFFNLDDEKLNQLINLRKANSGFDSLEDLKTKTASIQFKENDIDIKEITLQSNYFFIEAHSEAEGMQRTAMTLVKRIKNKDTAARLEVIWQVYL